MFAHEHTKRLGRGMVERLLPALGVRCTLRKQRSRFDSGKGTKRLLQ